MGSPSLRLTDLPCNLRRRLAGISQETTRTGGFPKDSVASNGHSGQRHVCALGARDLILHDLDVTLGVVRPAVPPHGIPNTRRRSTGGPADPPTVPRVARRTAQRWHSCPRNWIDTRTPAKDLRRPNASSTRLRKRGHCRDTRSSVNCAADRAAEDGKPMRSRVGCDRRATVEGGRARR